MKYDLSRYLKGRSTKLSHKQLRQLVKRERRQWKRREAARKRDELLQIEQRRREKSPTYQMKRYEELQREEEQQEKEEREREKACQAWLERERNAEMAWRAKQQLEKRKREEQEKEKLRSEEERKRIDEEKKAKKKAAVVRADGPTHNPPAPADYLEQLEQRTCTFFTRTGTCRYGDRCSKWHDAPVVSNLLLFPNMFTHFNLQQGSQREDPDIGLEHDDHELNREFRRFFEDIVPELEAVGRVARIRVCCNRQPHLRGNVYVQYDNETHAAQALQRFHGRFYAGRQLTGSYCSIRNWQSALCGSFLRQRCPKGAACNLLHCFRNPRSDPEGRRR